MKGLARESRELTRIRTDLRMMKESAVFTEVHVAKEERSSSSFRVYSRDSRAEIRVLIFAHEISPDSGITVRPGDGKPTFREARSCVS